MNLKELHKLSEEEVKGKSFYGIIVDEYTMESQKSLSEIGFIVQYNEDKTYVSDDLIDVILNYKNTDVNIVLEVPFDMETDVNVIHHMVRSVQADLSLLPPNSDLKSSESLSKYEEQLLEITNLWLEQTNVSYMLYPSSGYFHYMIREYFNGKTESISNEPYMVDNFVDTLSVEEMDSIKDNLKHVFYDHLGGKEGFAVYANSIASGLAEHVEEMAVEVIEHFKEEEKRHTESSE